MTNEIDMNIIETIIVFQILNKNFIGLKYLNNNYS